MSERSNVGDTVAVLWRRENSKCSASGEFQNRATDLVIPAGATIAIFPVTDKQSDRAPDYRVVVFPPKDFHGQGPGAGAGQGGGDDLPF